MKSMRDRDGDLAREIGQEEDRALEDGEQQEFAAFVIAGDLTGDLPDPLGDRILVQIGLAHQALEILLRPVTLHPPLAGRRYSCSSRVTGRTYGPA